MALRQAEENYNSRRITAESAPPRDGALKAAAGMIQKLSYREMLDLAGEIGVATGVNKDALAIGILAACDKILERSR